LFRGIVCFVAESTLAKIWPEKQLSATGKVLIFQSAQQQEMLHKLFGGLVR
jgi:hypothetical protein